MEQHDLFAGEALKAAGMAVTTLSNERWMDEATAVARRYLPHGIDFHPDEIRRIVAPFVGEPRHPNAWGAFASRLFMLRVIVGTGTIAKSKARNNHAHKYELVRRPGRNGC